MRHLTSVVLIALSATGCFKFSNVPKTLEGSAKPATYTGKCPIHFVPMTFAQIEADGQPHAEWKAPDADLKREMGEVPDEFNRMAKNCEALQGPPTSALKLSVRKAAFISHKPSTFSYDVTDASGNVVHAFAYTSALDWNPFIQARVHTSDLCSWVTAACDDKIP